MGNPGFAGFPYVLLCRMRGLGAGHGGRRRHAAFRQCIRGKHAGIQLPFRKGGAKRRLQIGTEELFEAADSIIIGEVCYQEFYQYEEQRSSYAQVWVEETLYGDQQPQKMLTVCEVGAKFGNGTEGSILQIPLLRKGQRVLLFLFENARLVPPWNNGCAIVGEYQGKFFYNQAENAWYHSGTLGTYADVPEGMRDPISDADMRRLIDSMANQ